MQDQNDLAQRLVNKPLGPEYERNILESIARSNIAANEIREHASTRAVGALRHALNNTDQNLLAAIQADQTERMHSANLLFDAIENRNQKDIDQLREQTAREIRALRIGLAATGIAILAVNVTAIITTLT